MGVIHDDVNKRLDSDLQDSESKSSLSLLLFSLLILCRI